MIVVEKGVIYFAVIGALHLSIFNAGKLCIC